MGRLGMLVVPGIAEVVVEVPLVVMLEVAKVEKANRQAAAAALA